ncbi:Down syndrome cell adhesion molecule-like protein, partial [Leptotrombidium deliense]
MIPMVQSMTENEGKPTRIMCSAYGDQPMTFEWKKDGEIVFDRMHLKVTTNKDDSFLRFERLQLSDSGNYTCIVKNTYGQRSQSFSLVVKAPVKWVNEPKNVQFKTGEIGYLECVAVGSPSPSITWKGKDNRTLSNTERFEFGDVSVKDAGLYECIADNG